MDFDQPDQEAYGRVTNPERYRAVVDAARAMIANLVKTYHVESTPGSRNVDFPDCAASSEEVTQLRPSQGVPLAFLFTEFPGVVVRIGDWCVEAFPACGCDACNESPREVVERLSDVVGAAVEGSYEEELTKRTLTYTYSGRWGSTSSEKRLDRGEWKRHGVPAVHRWPAWPKS
ncbi:MAG: DUF6226 family protein [Acidimicrobiia bacterium]